MKAENHLNLVELVSTGLGLLPNLAVIFTSSVRRRGEVTGGGSDGVNGRPPLGVAVFFPAAATAAGEAHLRT